MCWRHTPRCRRHGLLLREQLGLARVRQALTTHLHAPHAPLTRVRPSRRSHDLAGWWPYSTAAVACSALRPQACTAVRPARHSALLAWPTCPDRWWAAVRARLMAPTTPRSKCMCPRRARRTYRAAHLSTYLPQLIDHLPAYIYLIRTTYTCIYHLPPFRRAWSPSRPST